jgi:hypothetical protein
MRSLSANLRRTRSWIAAVFGIAKLYPGAQQTKDGGKALGRDQNPPLMALGRHIGMFKERTEVSGRGAAPCRCWGSGRRI